MRDKTEIWVKGHWSYSRSGERIWVPRHKMRENEKVHERHLHRLDEEIKGLKEQEYGRRKREKEAYA